jgi:hypothetical protein
MLQKLPQRQQQLLLRQLRAALRAALAGRRPARPVPPASTRA